MSSFEELVRECDRLWLNCRCTRLRLTPVKKQVQKENRRKAVELKADWETFLQHAADNLEDAGWKTEMDRRVLALLRSESVLNFAVLKPAVQEEFLSITKQFVRDAMCFDTALELDDIMQAMRNVWIILLLECMLERKLCYHKAIFAYSMLYPYTDNFLDDPAIDKQRKKAFNSWLSERLKGEQRPMDADLYRQVDALVSMIEDTFPRQQFPDVYDALLRIQEGQILSVQQDSRLCEEEIRRISIYKGGASVLADGYLMDGDLSEKEAFFCIAYGFLLQVADDIQDMEEDRILCQHTLASMLHGKRQRLRLAQRLHTYLHEVLFYHYSAKASAMQSFVEKNCRFLLIGSIAKQLHLFPKPFAYRMRRSLPLGLDAVTTLMNESSAMLQSEQIHAVIQAYVQAL